MPDRIQLKRTKGWKMPPNTVKVDRTTKWGNPFKPEQYFAAGYSGSPSVAIKHCVEAYRAWLEGKRHWAHPIPNTPTPDLSPLRGKNLACWCKIYDENGLRIPCHADVLLEIANGARKP